MMITTENEIMENDEIVRYCHHCHVRSSCSLSRPYVLTFLLVWIVTPVEEKRWKEIGSQERREEEKEKTHFVHHDSHPPAYSQIPHQNSYTPSSSQSTIPSPSLHIIPVYLDHQGARGEIRRSRGYM